MATINPATIDANAYYQVTLLRAIKWNHSWYRPNERTLLQGSTLLLPEFVAAIDTYVLQEPQEG